MSDLSGAWKQTLKSFILAFNDLGVTMIETAKVGADKVVTWAKTDNPNVVNTSDSEVPAQDEEE